MLDGLEYIIQRLLLEPKPDCAAIAYELRQRQRGLQDADLLLNQIVFRLTKALEQSESNGSVADAVALLRQLIRSSTALSLHPSLWAKLQARAEESRLVGYSDDSDAIRVMALPWESKTIAHTAGIDQFARRVHDELYVGDGMIYAMSEASGVAWTTYRSNAQKAAIDCWTFAAPGSTTLITLPTGSGKSLCTLLPPWFASRGGVRSRGTTLVVVPTVALALDQEKQANRFFEQAVSDLAKPISRTGDTSEDERMAIEEALRNGTLPILYTSPESLLNSRLHDAFLKAARSGLITRFVIDEAHLVASWGAGFRPEFQQLAAYRNQLLEASRGELRTLLLSATISDNSRKTLEQLFAKPNELVVVQANRLRPEIGYWLNIAYSEKARQQRVLEALRFLPRPLILYVTRPDHAHQWLATLQREGFSRLGEFTGKSDADSRRRLLKQWGENEIDIMVATSAFGLGVDKGDVRAVIHATLPENIDRFYQEVGRSGRDGFSAVSFLCALFGDSKDDIEMVYNLAPKILTLEKALPRWRSMVKSSVYEGGIRWIDRDATPDGRFDMQQSERNQEWNDHLLLMMHRAHLIEIVDAPPPRAQEDGSFLNRIPIRISDPVVFNDPERAIAAIEEFRQDEAEVATSGARAMIDLVEHYAKEQASCCLASEFSNLYDDVQEACGGCPVCRERQEAPYCPPLRFTVDYPTALQNKVVTEVEIDPILKNLLGAWRTLNVTWRGPRQQRGLQECVELLPGLVHCGFQQVVYPEELLQDEAIRDHLVQELAQLDPQRPPYLHRLIPDTWVVEENYPLFALATVVLYPTTDKRANSLYRALKRHKDRGIHFPGLINIIPEGLFLSSEGRHFVEHVDGLVESVEELANILQKGKELPAFF